MTQRRMSITNLSYRCRINHKLCWYSVYTPIIHNGNVMALIELKKQYFFKERIILKLLFVTLLHRSRAYVSLGPCHTCTLTFRCSAVNMVNSLKTTRCHDL